MSRIDPRTPRVRRGFTFIAMTAVLALSAIGITQCRLMDDAVTGVDLKSNETFATSALAKCQKECDAIFKQCKKDEDTRYKAAKKACDALPSAQKKVCKKAESERHKAEQKACSERKKACKKACEYREGGGGGGR